MLSKKLSIALCAAVMSFGCASVSLAHSGHDNANVTAELANESESVQVQINTDWQMHPAMNKKGTPEDCRPFHSQKAHDRCMKHFERDKAGSLTEYGKHVFEESLKSTEPLVLLPAIDCGDLRNEDMKICIDAKKMQDEHINASMKKHHDKTLLQREFAHRMSLIRTLIAQYRNNGEPTSVDHDYHKIVNQPRSNEQHERNTVEEMRPDSVKLIECGVPGKFIEVPLTASDKEIADKCIERGNCCRVVKCQFDETNDEDTCAVKTIGDN